jgi:hypothetical protein
MCGTGGAEIISKASIWKAIRDFCRECLGESKDDSICRNMGVHGECELYVYRGSPKRQGPDGQMLPEFRKPVVRRRVKSHCRLICLNEHYEIRTMCVSIDCPLRKIAVKE